MTRNGCMAALDRLVLPLKSRLYYGNGPWEPKLPAAKTLKQGTLQMMLHQIPCIGTSSPEARWVTEGQASDTAFALLPNVTFSTLPVPRIPWVSKGCDAKPI